MNGLLLVAGQGRCGSSVLLQMLHKGGMPVAGTFPDYECEEVNPFFSTSLDGRCAIPTQWLQAQDGRALKLLCPQMFALDGINVAGTLYLTRSLREQALSMQKLLGVSQAAAVAMEQSIAADDSVSLAILRLRGPLLRLSFEQIITDPRGTAAAVAAFVASCGGPALDVAAMTSAVLHRTPDCRPDMSIEAAQIQIAEERAANSARNFENSAHLNWPE